MNTEACFTSEMTALDEGKCFVTYDNDNHVTKKYLKCFGQPAIKYRLLSLASELASQPQLAILVCAGLRSSGVFLYRS